MRARLFAACALSALAAACGSGSNSIELTSPSAVKCQVSVANAMTDAVPFAGLSSAINVTTTRDCTWSASSNAGWLTLTSSASGQGSGSIEYRVAANGDPAQRRATIDVNNTRLEIVQEPAPCRFTVSPTSTAVSAAGGTFTIAIDTLTGCSWTAASDSGWITVNGTTSGNRSGTLSIAVAANTGGGRRGTITVAGQPVTVDQAAFNPAEPPPPPPTPSPTPTPVPCAYSIAPTSQNVAADAGSGDISVTTTVGCAWAAAPNAGWITIASGASGSGSGTVSLRFAANTDGARSGTVTVAGKTATINQAAVPCNYSISSNSQSIGADGGPLSVGVTAGGACGWTASSRASWITVTSGGAGSGNGTVQLSVAANTATTARAGTVMIANRTFTVTQAAAAPPPCTISISPSSQNVGDTGGPVTTAVTASDSSCTWTTTANVPWITVTTGASGSGNGNVQASVAANTGAARTGTLTIGGQTFTVNQAAPAPAPCTFSIAPNTVPIGDTGGPGSTTVTASASTCAWTAASNADWITIASGASGTGNGTVNFNVAANTGVARSGTVTVAGQTLTVNQAAPPPPPPPTCTYTLAPLSQTIAAAGGPGSISVTVSDSRCTWTATAGVDWITLTGPASGTGNGTVAFSVAPNSGSERTGAVTIAGQSATVTQSGQ